MNGFKEHTEQGSTVSKRHESKGQNKHDETEIFSPLKMSTVWKNVLI